MNDRLPAPSATSPESHSGSSERGIDRLFSEMASMYGAKFADLWRGTDIEKVKEKWVEKLRGFVEHPGVIQKALDALDERPFPPTLPEFLILCREAARRVGPRLPAIEYKPNPEQQAAFLEKVRQMMRGGNRGSDPMFWALHPRSHMAIHAIRQAAANEPAKFGPCIAKLIADGVCNEQGHLLKVYRGTGQWEAA